MKSNHCSLAGIWGVAAASVMAYGLLGGRALALDVIDPTGATYTGVSANSEYDHTSYGAANLFDTDVTGLADGGVLGGAGWARVGVDPGYVAFQLDKDYPIGSVFYAQRAGNDMFLDKITGISLWVSSTTPFTAADPGTAPATFVSVTEKGGGIWKEYLTTNTITGRYFLVKVEQNPKSGGNIGGTELRLGLANLSDPPAVSTQPTSHSLYVGGTARLSVRATGTAPLSYQWKRGSTVLKDGARISGANTSDLVISSVVTGDAGSYTCTIVNGAGSKISSAATLTVLAIPTSGIASAIVSNMPVAYWRLNEASGSAVVSDCVGSFDGSYGPSSFEGIDGPKGSDFPGFPADNTAALITGYVVDSAIALPGMNLETNTVTILAWVYPVGSQHGYTGIVFSRASGTVAGLIFGGDGANLAYQWGGKRYDFDSKLSIPSDQWSLVALVTTPNDATLYLGANRVLASSVDQTLLANQSFSGVTYIGLDTDLGEADRTFNGVVDDVAIFNRSLSRAEIQAIYSSGVGIVQAVPVEFTKQPVDQNVLVGENVHFEPLVTGTVPITYQWFKSNTAVSGAQSRTLSLVAGLGDAGDYYLVASNQLGAVTSAVAHVTVSAENVVVLNPAGSLYTGVSANNEYPGGGYVAANLFTTDVTGVTLGTPISGAEWAENGSDPGFVAFQVDQSYPVKAIYYAQRAGNNPTLDKITRISVWTSSTTAFDPMSQPANDPAGVIAITDSTGGAWDRYLLPATINGQYFLIKIEQDPKVGGNIGGNELRLGVVAPKQENLKWSWSQAGLILEWSSGTLQQADFITGPWNAATGVSSGVPIPATGTQKFYRIQY